jgi:hypothetical protein
VPLSPSPAQPLAAPVSPPAPLVDPALPALVNEPVIPSEPVASTVTPSPRSGDLFGPAQAIVAAAPSREASIAGLIALGTEHGLDLDHAQAFLLAQALRERLTGRAEWPVRGRVTS